ncbi:sigma-70 family RNA polymerase sigma factor [Streptomyces sp. NPDC048737]|uniref:sigma-70 family RNA polymerase sigma factor n=1 Tax=unclassified Streptomyces TaxID=2593676 RepID=UPI003423C347
MRALLRRYADPEGYVTSRALDGVARLAGLNPRDAAALRAGARVRGAAAATVEAAADAATGGEAVRDEAAAPVAEAAGTGPTALVDTKEHELEDVPEGEPFLLPDAATAGDLGDLAPAVAAALTVLEDDRFRRRPETRLLSAEAEVGLAVLVRGGPDHVAEEPHGDTLSGLPSDDLRIRARDCLVLHNQRLVHKMVPRYLEQGLDYDDLFQHGALGLMRAARKFDPSKGFKFSTYATWWIRQSISRGIADEGAVIRIPVHMHEQVRKVALAERNLALQGRPAGVADVAVYCDMTLQKVEEARRLSRRTDSLDRVVGDGVTLGDFIGRTNPLPPVDRVVLGAMLLEQIMEVVDTFPEREAHILVRRLGLDGDEPSTLEELGQHIGRTRERVRQIESKAKKEFRDRLVAAGLTAAYQDDGGLGEEPDRAGEPAGVRRPGSRAGAPKELSGAGRMPDTPPGPAPQQAQPEVPPRPAGAGETPDGGHSTETGAAVAPGDRTARGEASAGSPQDVPPDALGAPAAEPEEQAGRRSAEPSDDLRPVPRQEPGHVADTPGAGSGAGPVPKPGTGHMPQTAQESTPSAPAVVPEAGGLPVSGPAAREPARFAADWQKALRMPTDFGGGVAWLAEYALLAVGHVQLTVLLGPSSADAVVRAVRDRGMLDRPVVTALEVLRRVFDAVKEAGLRPEDFFERPAEALLGVTPRAYLAAKPLVLGESRLALRDSLREFVAELPQRAGRAAARTGGSPGGPAAGRHAEAIPGPEDSARTRAAAGEAPGGRMTASADGPRGEADGPTPESPPSPGEVRPDVTRAEGATDVEHDQASPEAGTVPDGERPRDDTAGPRAMPHGAGDPRTGHGRADTSTVAGQPASPLGDGLASVSPRTSEEVSRAGAAARGTGQGGAGPDAERRLTELRHAHEAELTRLRDEAQRRLTEERRAADDRHSAALADAEQQLDALEETLLRRADRAVLRRERHLRAQADERIAHIEEVHREARQTLVERAEHAEQRERAARTALAAAGERAVRAERRAKDAEQAVRTAEERANDAERRASTAEERAAVLYQRANDAQRRAEETGQRLRRHHEEGEARVAALEQRLRQAEALLAERDMALRAAQQQASAQVAAAEQRAAARITQTEHDAWARITELQQQLAAEREAAAERSAPRSRWRWS